MIITYRNFSLPPLLELHDDHYIQQLFHFLLGYNFIMIITYRNFFTSPFLRTSWWSLDTATFSLPPLLQLYDDHYIQQVFHFLLCYNFMMIITYSNFFTSSFVRTLWWSLHTATFSLRPLLELYDDHYIPQLFHFRLCYNFMMIITYSNFFTSSFVRTLWWSLHTATSPLPSML